MAVLPWVFLLFFLQISDSRAASEFPNERPPVSRTDPEALEVIRRHLEAIGGEERLRAVRTLVLDCRVGNVSGNPRVLTRSYMSPNYYRLEVAGAQAATVTDGVRVWAANEEGWIEYSRPNTTINLNQQNLFYDLLYFEEKGIEFEYLGSVELAGSDLHRLQKTHRDGSTKELFFSAETGLLTLDREEFNGEMRQVSYFNYREVKGINMPFYWVVSYAELHPPHVLWVEEAIVDLDLDSALFLNPGGKMEKPSTESSPPPSRSLPISVERGT